MSAALFLLCVNPFLIHFEVILARQRAGEVRACADDIGASLTDFRELRLLFTVFDLAEKIANLKLKPPNAKSFRPARASLIRFPDFLAIGCASTFQIGPVFVGPLRANILALSWVLRSKSHSGQKL